LSGKRASSNVRLIFILDNGWSHIAKSPLALMLVNSYFTQVKLHL